MISAYHDPFAERDSAATRWVVYFVVLSLVAHGVLLAAILIITRFMPVPKFTPPKEPPTVTLTLVKAPPVAPPKPPGMFMPTKPQQDAVHKEQRIESANDTELQSKAKAARDPESIMPDAEGQKHASNLVTSPEVRAPDSPQVSSTPPQPKVDKPTPPQPPTPKPQTGKTQPSEAKQPAPPKPVPPKAQPAVDPETGLPVLPPISASTMAPPNSAAKPLAPAPSQQQTAADIHGAMGRSGDTSPAAMATELGKYKQYMYSVVGSYWYPDIDRHFGLIPVGVVRIRYTIHSDGTLSDVTVIEGGNLDILKTISMQALVKPAPFKPFTAGMIKQVGDSFTDDFSFSIYGQ